MAEQKVLQLGKRG